MIRGPDLRVGQMMTTRPETIDGMTTVNGALTIMQEKNISALVVERRNPDDEFGLLLISDIARGISQSNRPVSRIHVYEIMQKPAPAVDSGMKLRYAIRHMTRFGISHCVVLTGRELSGIVSLRDMTIRFLEKTERSPTMESQPE